MAQLIKLTSFPSRYESNIYQYSSRFVQRKQRRYQSFIEKFGPFASKEEEKSRFYDDFYKGQLIWATSTPNMEAPTNGDYFTEDPFLKQLVRMFDDTALVLYRPTLQVEGTDVDCDLIILTPLAVWCLQIVKGEPESVFQGVNTKEWKEITSQGERVLANPYIALSNSIQAIKEIFEEHNMEVEIKSCIYVPESYVEFAQYGSAFEVIDRTKVKDWTAKINHHRSTLKHGQLRAAELLLKKTKTTATIRV